MKDGNFEVGDVVYLKSGSPRMTITKVIGASGVEVSWIVYDTGALHKAAFPHETIRIADDKAATGRTSNAPTWNEYATTR